jgi:type I restriction enzyme S subunit
MTAGVRAGYKLTEVGVIPQGWGVDALGRLATIERGKFSARPRNDPKFYGGDIPFIQTGDVTRSNRAITTFTQTLNSEGLLVSRLFPKGTLFFTIAANIGDVGIAQFEAACPDSLVAISPSPLIDKAWLLYELAHRKEDFEKLASPGAQLNINLEKLRPYLLPVPSFPEQRAIAAALGDMDALLDGLERLIAKKRDLKVATMQQLLTGQTRLPGFSGEWVVKRLGDLAEMGSGGTPLSSVPAYYDGEIPWVAISDMTKGGKIIKSTERNLTALGLANSAAQIFPIGTILYAMYASLGECSIAGVLLSTSQAILGIRPKSNLNADFLYYFLTSLKSVVKTLGQQGTQSNLNKGMVQDFRLNLPPLPEQTAIATVLSDLDAELAALQARRDKTRDLKQAMAQELLTGSIRLA